MSHIANDIFFENNEEIVTNMVESIISYGKEAFELLDSGAASEDKVKILFDKCFVILYHLENDKEGLIDMAYEMYPEHEETLKHYSYIFKELKKNTSKY